MIIAGCSDGMTGLGAVKGLMFFSPELLRSMTPLAL